MSAHFTSSALLAGAVSLSFLASGASATTVSLVYDGTSASPAQSVTISSTPTGVTPAATTVGAFGFNMQDLSGSLGDFLAWCLDLGSRLSTSSTVGKDYTITSTPFSNSFGLDVSRVQAVFDANFSNVDATDGVQAAGFQVALWNAVYDTNWLADAGDFQISGNADVITQANTYLSAANAFSDDRVWNLTFLQSADNKKGGSAHQNLVTATPIPLPAAAWMLLAGLAGLGVAGRRRKAA